MFLFLVQTKIVISKMPRKTENNPEKTKKERTLKHIKAISGSIQKILTFTSNMEFREQCLSLVNAKNSQEAGKKLEQLLKKKKLKS